MMPCKKYFNNLVYDHKKHGILKSFFFSPLFICYKKFRHLLRKMNNAFQQGFRPYFEGFYTLNQIKTSWSLINAIRCIVSRVSSTILPLIACSPFVPCEWQACRSRDDTCSDRKAHGFDKGTLEALSWRSPAGTWRGAVKHQDIVFLSSLLLR